MLLVTAGILLVATLLEPHPDVVRWFGYDVPILCPLRLATGLGCPGCGMTRSFSFVMHGDLGQAFAMNPLGPVLWTLVAAQVPYRSLRLFRAWRGYTDDLGASA